MKSIAVCFGRQKLEGRLIWERVPDAVKAQRIEKYNRTHAMQGKKGRQWLKTALKELLCGYNLYLTNAPQDKLKDEDISLIYGLRWQIELVFKMWKSLLFLDQVGPMSVFRFECFLYSRLLYILLSTELMSAIKAMLREEVSDVEIEISEWKTMKLIKKKFWSIVVAIGQGIALWLEQMQLLIEQVLRTCIKERRKDKSGHIRLTPLKRIKRLA